MLKVTPWIETGERKYCVNDFYALNVYHFGALT